MQVSDIMSSPVVSVDAESTLEEAVGEMLDNRVGSVLVIETGLWGIVTRSDVLRSLYPSGPSLDDVLAKDVMTADVVTIEPDSSIESALRLMEKHEIKKLPVISTFEVVGIVTATDIAWHQPSRVREVRQAIQRRDEWTD